ncbi:MAG: SpoOM protein [Acinetobacter sp. GWC1_38_13]|jgi:sporulation-control protein|uniref:sporulation protein n=1 Tax=Acinetobacter TaxID=469 RepID=UPI0008CA7015|nr:MULTISPECIES: sporulation protein [Acinetobacter]MDH0666137.1 sporulation protein [Acinetobacter junii]MDH1375092.1 sporulation protein [Acinetobacter junii]MDH1691359.1 sporulation protein [Acinetobacter junii]OFW44521.1 MAG: SpoOM protein [Acinetobacter sp. GWC1_38_13]RTE47443.1 sporulation protein [Acinetobacter junii]
MFNKIMSGLGLQGVTVETRLQNPNLQAGETLHGEISFKGGSSDKEINGLYLQLMTMAEVESGDHEFNQPLILQEWLVNSRFLLPAHQAHSFPFSIQLPFETPITEVACRRNGARVWIQTHMDVDWGLDATDRDYLKVLPTAAMQSFLQAMQQCGFVLSTVDVEKGQLTARNFRSTIGCYQELEFVSSHMFSGFNEVEVSFVAEAQQTHIMLEIDRTFRSDQLLTMTISNQNLDVNQITQQIRRLLQIA